MKNSRCAPVIIPTLNRYEHLKRCIESLEKCEGADQTPIYVGLDFPPSEKYREGWKLIKNFLKKKVIENGFKSLVVIERTENLGAIKNIEALESYISQQSDRYIFTEDDNEFSPNFLDYINKGLNIFENVPNVYAICGYNYPINMTGYDGNYYFSHEYSAWGVGKWSAKDRIIKAILQKDNYLRDFCKNQPLSLFIKNNFRLLPFVRYINEGYLGDAYITTFLQSNQYYCVFPKISLVRNWGHDGTGVNCREYNETESLKYSKQEIQNEKEFSYEEVGEIIVPSIVKRELIFFNKTSLKSKIKSLFLLILLKIH